MKLLITGATGFIGQAVVRACMQAGYTLVIATRNPDRARQQLGECHAYYQWDALAGPLDHAAIGPVDGILNLMGEGVAERRWTRAQRQRIWDTRVVGTQNLLAGLPGQSLPAVYVGASAIGYYDHTHRKSVSESTPPGSDFMSQLCVAWEAAHAPLMDACRTVVARWGVVLGPGGGALAAMRGPFEWGVAGRLGSGQQWMNWIHRADAVRIIMTAVADTTVQGVYNAVAPGNVTNHDFTAQLAQAVRRPAVFPVPAMALRLVVGGMATVLVQGARVVSDRLDPDHFLYPTLDAAIADALPVDIRDGRHTVCRSLTGMQWVPHDVATVFDFFSKSENLTRITPPFLQFHVASQSTPQLGEGTDIAYRLRVRGLPMRWQSRITQWAPNACFVDDQRSGPYRVWHHTHRFWAYQGGTVVEDSVRYALPAIPLISRLVQPLVDRDIASIFAYRNRVLPACLAQGNEKKTGLDEHN